MKFREKHPVVTGFVILTGIFLLFWVGISLLVSSLLPSQSKHEIFGPRDAIGVVELTGLIVSPEKTIKELAAFRKNENIRAVILRIDSPGGAVGASQEIFEEVKRTNAVKPVVASMGSVAASGGYYAALGARQIIANPGTLTGSIGVIIKFPNLEELFDKIGYKKEVIKSGLMKDIGAADRTMTDEERALLQELIANIHAQFVQAVADRRSIPLEKVQSLADGRIYSGEQALREGLIDELGNFTAAVTRATKLAEIESDDPPLIYPEEERFSLLKMLAGTANPNLLENLVHSRPILSYEWTGGLR